MRTFTIIKKFENKTKIRCVCGNQIYVKSTSNIQNPCTCDSKNSRSELANRSLNIYKNRALNDNLSFKLNESHFDHLINSNCFYCYESPRMYSEKIERVGIDRLDNTIGYERNNVISCCDICNNMKKDLTLEQFYDKIKRIHDHILKFESMKTHSTERNHYLFKRGALLGGSHVARLIIEGKITREEVKYDVADTLLENEAELNGFLNLLVEGVSLYEGTKKAKSKVMKASFDKICKLYRNFIENGRVDENLMAKLILNKTFISYN